MYRPVLISAVLMFGLAGAAAPASGAEQPTNQAVCGERQQIAESLARKYSEEPVSIGLNVDGGVLEVFASKAGTWTILLTAPNGHSCVMTAGENWESLPKSAGSKIKGQES